MSHADIREQKGMQSYELACAHKKRSEISGETRFVGLVARPVRRAFHGCQGHSGLGRACNMKVCVGVSKLRLLEHILLLNSWPSRCPSCPSSPPSFPHATFRVRGMGSKNEMSSFFFPLLVQIEQRKASKAPKNRFSKRTHFSGVRHVCFEF
jgi:hypothetical protein